jgi:aryl-alcohol dehydrogenase-like predicted oxidoreductase
MQAFGRLVQKGKVRAIGASNLKVWRIAEANILSQTGNPDVKQTWLRWHFPIR